MTPPNPQSAAANDVIRQRSSQIVLIQDTKGLGTGVLVSDDGWVLTNKHVAPSVGPYRVILADGRDVHGVGVHQSPHQDLAIVKIKWSGGAFLDLERDLAAEYMLGAEVFALGHPRGCRFSVARGIISNPYREVDGDYFVQTDVSINPGNSGGPLIDRAGRLVGIVSMMFSESQGLGFAVPGHAAADYARQVHRLVRHGIIRIPESLLDGASHRVPAVEAVRTAVATLVASGSASVEEENPDLGFIKLRKQGSSVEIVCRDGVFQVSAHLAAVGSSELANPRFLAELLRINASRELGGASLCLRDQTLQACIVRPTTGLDTMEASWAIDLALHVAAAWPSRLNALLFQPPPPPAGNAAEVRGQAQPVPTPTSADPGYPVVASPPPWKG